jgi:hypothetical protein
MGRKQKVRGEEKWCPACSKWRPLKAFWKDADRPSGRRAFCSSCERNKKNTWQGSNRTLLGATQEIIEEIWKHQGGVCGLCGKEIEGGMNVADLDHDHLTGVLRGLIHRHCNILLGILRDDAVWMKQAAAYLEKKLPD